jgi:hypothetical protein
MIGLMTGLQVSILTVKVVVRSFGIGDVLSFPVKSNVFALQNEGFEKKLMSEVVGFQV